MFRLLRPAPRGVRGPRGPGPGLCSRRARGDAAVGAAAGPSGGPRPLAGAKDWPDFASSRDLRSRRIAEGIQRLDPGTSGHRARELRLATAEMQHLGRQRQWQEALLLFSTVPNPDVILNTAVLDACAKGLQLDRARKLFSEMPVKTVPTYNVLILLLGRLQRPQEAEELVQEMKRQGLQPNESTFSSLITAYGVVQDADTALRVLEDMRSVGLVPSAPTYGAVMTACGRAGDRVQAAALLARMDEERVKPDAGHFSALIVAHARAGDEVGARGALQELRRRGLRPSVVAYTSLLVGLSGPTALAKAEAVFAEMRSECVQPDTMAYNAMLSAALASRATEKFWSTVAEMEAKGIKGNEQTELRIADCRALAQEALQTQPRDELRPLPPGWCEHRDPASGRSYYWAEADPAGTTTWERPG